MAVVGAEQAWATATGAGVVIAVVDTGVHLTHEDLAVGDKLLPGRDYVTPDTAPQDDNGHGTHVAGIASAAANNGRGVVGVAPSARIMPIKVLNASGRGNYTNVASAIRWAADNGAHIVNLSLGSTIGNLFGNPDDFVGAIRYAWSKGVLCVVAAGNDFVLSSSFAKEPAIVVSATTPSDTAATYSNGVGKAEWALAAPGGAGSQLPQDEDEDIYSTYWPHAGPGFSFGPYEYLAGTSMAAPHVAGAAALLRSLGLSPQQTIDRLLASAKDLGPPGRDNVYGHGRLDVARAVTGLAGSGNTTGGGGSTSTTSRRNSGGSRGGTEPSSSGSGSSGGGSTPGPRTVRGTDGSAVTTVDGDGETDADATNQQAGRSDEEGRGLDVGDAGGGGDNGTGSGQGNGDASALPWPVVVLGVALLALAGAAIARSASRRLARPAPPR